MLHQQLGGKSSRPRRVEDPLNSFVPALSPLNRCLAEDTFSLAAFMRRIPFPSSTLFIFLTASLHILLAPYTKVEESFTLHATHDVLAYGLEPRHLPKVSSLFHPTSTADHH